MKLSWGTSIAVIYILFVVIIVSIAVWLSNKDLPLVTDNYYAKELKYQEEIDKINRTNELDEKLEIKVSEEMILLTFPRLFPSDDIEGNIVFYRPNDESKDFIQEIKIDTTYTQSVYTKNIQTGLWKIKVNWQANNVEYYNEKLIMIN
ncbi:MAG: hypothetical protein FJ214_07330 [Ignavibacteria bacterium]|nr:hypothetical protein [Ignavibacteria bacterium]